MENAKKLELMASKEVVYNEELYIIVDFLNKSLKDRNIIFGLAMDGRDKAVISIYNT